MENPRPLSRTTDVIAALGGVAAVARLTGRKYSAAWNWRKAETFPANTYLAMSQALKAAGLAAPPSLWGMAGSDNTNPAARKRREAESAA